MQVYSAIASDGRTHDVITCRLTSLQIEMALGKKGNELIKAALNNSYVNCKPSYRPSLIATFWGFRCVAASQEHTASRWRCYQRTTISLRGAVRDRYYEQTPISLSSGVRDRCYQRTTISLRGAVRDRYYKQMPISLSSAVRDRCYQQTTISLRGAVRDRCYQQATISLRGAVQDHCYHNRRPLAIGVPCGTVVITTDDH